MVNFFVPRDYLACSSSSDNVVVFNGAFDNHDGIVEGTFDFGDELFCATSEDESTCLCIGCAFKEIISLSANLEFVECFAGSEMFKVDIRTCRLNTSANSSDNSI
jgi:hypothetical protein